VRPKPSSEVEEPVGPWDPLRRPVFRSLWTAQAVSNIGTWMQTVAAQWFLTERNSPASVIALVQTATSLPVLLLALPAGGIADLIDRRRLLIAVQGGMATVAAALAVLAGTNRLTEAGLLGLTFALGAGTALTMPAWQAIQPELVPRRMIPAAAALGGVSINLARAVGPAIGGLLVAVGGPTWVFALNAASFLLVTWAVARWRRPRDPARPTPEGLGAAMRAGLGYVAHSPILRRILLRAGLWVFPASSLWALLPVVASRQLGLGSAGYGVLLGSLGVGAVGGAVMLGRIDLRRQPNRLLLGCSALYAAALAVLATGHSAALACIVLLLAGASWLGVLSTLNALAQLMLPRWVRARALAAYQLVFQGGQAVGAALWGVLAVAVSLRVALLTAAGVLLAGGLSIRWLGLYSVAHLDPRPSAHWPEPNVVLDPLPDTGPVLVIVEYQVPPENAAAFVAAMERQARSRRRTGARRWGLFQDGANPTRFLEVYLVRSWAEHLQQHSERLTVSDRQAEEAVRALVDGPVRVSHLFAPTPETLAVGTLAPDRLDDGVRADPDGPAAPG
jgi:MFS family permease